MSPLPNALYQSQNPLGSGWTHLTLGLGLKGLRPLCRSLNTAKMERRFPVALGGTVTPSPSPTPSHPTGKPQSTMGRRTAVHFPALITFKCAQWGLGGLTVARERC